MSEKYIVNGKDTRALVLIENIVVHPTVFQMDHTVIAYMLSGAIVCPKCALPHDLSDAAAVCPIHIVPYSQSCHQCGRILVSGWPCQLFDKPEGPTETNVAVNTLGLTPEQIRRRVDLESEQPVGFWVVRLYNDLRKSGKDGRPFKVREEAVIKANSFMAEGFKGTYFILDVWADGRVKFNLYTGE